MIKKSTIRERKIFEISLKKGWNPNKLTINQMLIISKLII
jgi:hypothetical protein